MSNNAVSVIALLLLFTHGVFGGVRVLLKEGQSVTLNTGDAEIPRDDLIFWVFGNEAFNIAEGNETMVPLYCLDERFRDRLHLDDGNGDLTIRNMREEHSGWYQVKIITKRATIYKRFSVTVFSINILPPEFVSAFISVFMYAFLLGLSVLMCLLSS